jgi:hypothetical protein
VDLKKIIEELREEQSRVNQAILAMEAVASKRYSGTVGLPAVKRRGRPPGSRNKPKMVLIGNPPRPGSSDTLN